MRMSIAICIELLPSPEQKAEASVEVCYGPIRLMAAGKKSASNKETFKKCQPLSEKPLTLLTCVF